MSVVKINALSVPAAAGPELERRFAERAGTVENQPGFLGFQLLRPAEEGGRYFVVTQWEDEASFTAWRDGAAGEAHATPPGEQPREPVSSGAELLEFEVVLDVPPTRS